MNDEPICPKCNGKGTVTHDMAPERPIDLGEGMTVQACGGHFTRACSCVRDLPAIDGRVTWWESETIYSNVVPLVIGDEAIEVRARCEVPRNDAGRRMLRTHDNAYWPPLIELETDGGSYTLMTDHARKLATALLAAADACDAADALAQKTASL